MSDRVVLLAFCLVFTCAQALAQDASSEDRARARFLDGRAAYEQRDYDRALAAWQESYGISQRPELLYNVGLAAQKLGRRDLALESFEAYLTWGKGERAEEVRGRVDALRDLAANEAYPPEAATPAVPSPAAVARASQPASDPVTPPAPKQVERQRSSARGWWIAAGVVLAAAAIAVGVAVPLSQRDTKSDNVPEPNTGLTINALRWAP